MLGLCAGSEQGVQDRFWEMSAMLYLPLLVDSFSPDSTTTCFVSAAADAAMADVQSLRANRKAALYDVDMMLNMKAGQVRGAAEGMQAT
jgi:hypothetical protein